MGPGNIPREQVKLRVQTEQKVRVSKYNKRKNRHLVTMQFVTRRSIFA